MIRTNPSFLSMIESLYESSEGRENILLKQFDEGEIILNQGQTVTKVLLIKQGVSKCYFTEENGKDFILEFLGVGEILGEIEIIRGMNCLCNVQAITAVQVYAISAAYFRLLLDKSLELNKLLIAELAERIVNTSSRASSLQLYTMEHGLTKLLEFQRKQNIILSKENMAAYLGITLRSLNRLLKETRM